MKPALKALRPSQEFIDEARKVISRSPDMTLDEIFISLPARLFEPLPRHESQWMSLAKLGWALAEIAAVEDAERLPGSPFGKQLRQALKDAPDFEPAPSWKPGEQAQRFELAPPVQVVEAPALAFWREAYLAALDALLDPTLHFSDAGQGVSVVAASIADRAAIHFEELRTTRLAELVEGARQIAEQFRKEPRQ